jgi:prolipoprotein diacylglyceryl transferase
VLRVIAQSIPSPSNGVWHLGPLPVRGYALAIILGIVAAIWIGERRWAARGGRPGEVQDLAVWAVPFGLVGGRLYHVATDHDLYFGPNGNTWQILYVWKGGLGVWGSIFLGAIGGIICARRKGMRIGPMVDALAPGLLVAQALGRWGNWFNQELYGKPTDLPWGLEIDPQNYPSGKTFPPGTTFHPTFLYECVWDLSVFGVLIALDRRFKIGHGRMLALYVMGYTLGRGWIETLRIDTVELNDVHGLRFNVWTSIVLFVVAAVYFVVSLRLRPGQEAEVYVEGRGPQPALTPGGEPAPVELTEDAPIDLAPGVHEPETRAGPPPDA